MEPLNKKQGSGPAPRPDASPSAAKQRKAGSRLLYLVLGALLALLASYVIGRLQTASRIEVAEKRATEAKKTTEKKVSELSVERDEVARLEARRRLHLALVALDSRNFGIAQEHLTAAASLLSKSHPDKSSDLAKIAAEITGYHLKASEDVGAERDRLMGWVRRFDAAMPPAKP